jgi:glutamyl-tRNA reductase
VTSGTCVGRTPIGRVALVGMNYKTTPDRVLGMAAIAGRRIADSLRAAAQPAGPLQGGFVLATCNRVEVYASGPEPRRLRPLIGELLARSIEAPAAEISSSLYVSYGFRAVQHLLAVASGLDSMATGETQVLGQLRRALANARACETLDRILADLGAHAVRTARQVRRDCWGDATPDGLVVRGLALAIARLGPADQRPDCLTSVIVGAGAVGKDVAGRLQRAGVGKITIANRTVSTAEHVAATIRGAAATSLGGLAPVLADADLVVSCTSAPGTVLTRALLSQALARKSEGGALVVLDLAMPPDTEPAAASLARVSCIGLDAIRAAGVDGVAAAQTHAAWAIVSSQAQEFSRMCSAVQLDPLIIAFTAHAQAIAAAEFDRLARRLGGDPVVTAEVEHALSRVTGKLTHLPIARLKTMAGTPAGDACAAALEELFGLRPRNDAVEARKSPAC